MSWYGFGAVVVDILAFAAGLLIATPYFLILAAPFVAGL